MRLEQITRCTLTTADKSCQSVLTHLAIFSHPKSGEVSVSFEDLARVCSMSISTLQRSIKQLEKTGFIRCWRACGRTHESHFEIDLQAVEKDVIAREKALGVKFIGIKALKIQGNATQNHGNSTNTDAIKKEKNKNPKFKKARELTLDEVFVSTTGQRALHMGLGVRFYTACRNADQILGEDILSKLAEEQLEQEKSYLPSTIAATRAKEENLREKYIGGKPCHLN